MNSEADLKKRLRSIRGNNWVIPHDVDSHVFAQELLRHIGSTDPELRDDLVLKMLSKMISQRELPDEQIRILLGQCLSGDHLLCGLGQTEDDSVFNRSFTLLIIEEIIRANNRSEVKILDDQDVRDAYSETLQYFLAEKDVRGYVEAKGWAHASAHAADLLWSLAQSEAIGHDQLIAILEAIRQKVCIDWYVYINNEDERLVNAVVAILSRKLIRDEEFVAWVAGFGLVEKKDCYLRDERLQINIKMFLRSLYFRLAKSSAATAIAAIERSLEKRNF